MGPVARLHLVEMGSDKGVGNAFVKGSSHKDANMSLSVCACNQRGCG